MQTLPELVVPGFVHDRIQRGDGALLVDVRTQPEFNDGHAKGAINIPLDLIGLQQLNSQLTDWDPDAQPVFLLCEAGHRANQAAEKLRQEGLHQLAVIEGGTSAWRQADLPMQRKSRLLSLERQTQITLGALLMVLLFKGALIHPAFYLLIGLIAAGLVVAGVTARCSLTTLLARMPWNQRPNTT